jgi:hypothetical protein
MSMGMAWFYNLILLRIFEIGLVVFNAPPTQSVGRVCIKFFVFPKEFANVKIPRLRKTTKTAIFQWPAHFPIFAIF